MQATTLSESALSLLHRRLSGERVEITAETRPLYEELVDAGLVDRLHTLTGGDNSAYRLTESAVIFAGRRPASSGASPAPTR